MISADRLRELLDYNHETGALTWRVARGAKAKAGTVAGSPNSKGYLTVKVDNKTYRAHRLAWLMFHGSLPELFIDHVNGDKLDNRICNLRAATNSENQQNKLRARRDSLSGLLGVYTHENGRWRSSIKVDGKQKHLGCFDTPEEAHSVYLKAKAELHPFQTIVESAP